MRSDLVFGTALLHPSLDVDLGFGVMGDADHDDAPQGAVELAVPTLVGPDLPLFLADPVRMGATPQR